MKTVDFIKEIDDAKTQHQESSNFLAHVWVSLNAKEIPPDIELTKDQLAEIMKIINDTIGKNRCLIEWNKYVDNYGSFRKTRREILSKILV